MEHKVADVGRVDPEAQAGRALRRLRLARNWSQEETAERMTAYGHDFHQTTIAKIEAAQRPLRVRELADFAALYGVEVQDLIHPPTRSLPEIEQEISEVTATLTTARKGLTAASHHLDGLRQATRDAEAAYRTVAAEVTVLEGRLGSLSADREKVIAWESDTESFFREGDHEARPDASGPMAASFTSTAGPSVLRIILGSQLRRLREEGGITPERAGYEIRASRSKISRMETGRVGFKVSDLEDLLALYGVTDEESRNELITLAQKSNAPSWWHDYLDILPGWFENYIGLEMAATDLWIYEGQSVPELLQTEDYFRSVTLWNQTTLSAPEIERRVRFRTTRQDKSLGRSNPPNLRVVLDEVVLRRQVGAPGVMRDQLSHLVEIAERPNITVQVLPLQSLSSAQGSFNILSFSELNLPDIVYMEQLTGAVYLEQLADVDAYHRLMQRLSAQALSPQQTTQFLGKLLQ